MYPGHAAFAYKLHHFESDPLQAVNFAERLLVNYAYWIMVAGERGVGTPFLGDMRSLHSG
jgi:hypothetical protein